MTQRLPIILLTGVFVIASTVARAQLTQRSEVGGGLGIFNYTGDLVRTFDITTSKPAATIFYRSNISKVISFRTSLTGGQLAASDKHNPLDPAAVKRNASFNIFLMELAGTFEYHFLDWRDDRRRLRFTPYVFAGMGMFMISGNNQKTTPYSNVQLAIPFGVGVKYVLNPKYYIAAEFGVEKLSSTTSMVSPAQPPTQRKIISTATPMIMMP